MRTGCQAKIGYFLDRLVRKRVLAPRRAEFGREEVKDVQRSIIDAYREAHAVFRGDGKRGQRHGAQRRPVIFNWATRVRAWKRRAPGARLPTGREARELSVRPAIQGTAFATPWKRTFCTVAVAASSSFAPVSFSAAGAASWLASSLGLEQRFEDSLARA